MWDKEGIRRSKSGAMCRSKFANVSADGYALSKWKLGREARGVFDIRGRSASAAKRGRLRAADLTQVLYDIRHTSSAQ